MDRRSIHIHERDSNHPQSHYHNALAAIEAGLTRLGIWQGFDDGGGRGEAIMKTTVDRRAASGPF